jgi:hypothetical protein
MGMVISRSKFRNEPIWRNARLSQQPRQSAGLDFSMVWNDAAAGTSAHDDVTAALPNDLEAEPLERAHRLGAGDAR